MNSNTPHPDGFTDRLLILIRFAVRLLALLMVFVIFMGVADVVWVLYHKLLAPPFLLLQISDILATFGAFMAVLIAIEIFINITIYLREDVIHIRIVLATALMAVARKIIILDLDELSPQDLWGLAAVALALGIGYWLIVARPLATLPGPDDSDLPLPQDEEVAVPRLENDARNRSTK